MFIINLVNQSSSNQLRGQAHGSGRREQTQKSQGSPRGGTQKLVNTGSPQCLYNSGKAELASGSGVRHAKLPLKCIFKDSSESSRNTGTKCSYQGALEWLAISLEMIWLSGEIRVTSGPEQIQSRLPAHQPRCKALSPCHSST